MSHSRKPVHSVNSIPTLAYWRMSSDDQEASIPQQEAWGKDIAARDNLNIVGQDADHGISGSDFDSREGLQRLIAFAQKLFEEGRPARRLLVWKANRLSRADTCDTHAQVIHPLRQAGIREVQTSDKGTIDLHDRNALLLFNIEQDAASAQYLSGLATDVLRGKADIAREGFWNGGPAPIGYRIERTGDPRGRRRLSRLVLGPDEEVEFIRWLFTTYAETAASYLSLARMLNKEGRKPSRAAAWTANSIASLLCCRTFLGECSWNERHVGKHAAMRGGRVVTEQAGTRDETRRRKRLKDLPTEWNAPEDVVIRRDAHPRIISDDLFNAVQSKIAGKTRGRRVQEERFYELQDLMSCGHCTSKLWIIPVKRDGRKLLSKVECSAHRKGGAEACSLSGQAHHGEILRRVLLVLSRDLADKNAQEKIRQALKKKAAASGERIGKDIKAAEKSVSGLEEQVKDEARRLLALPASVLPSAIAAHEETLKQLQAAKERLDDLKSDKTANPVCIELAERAMGMLADLPDLAASLEEIQDDAHASGRAREEGEALTIRRKIRDVLFSLVSVVRVFWRPIDPEERKGKGKGHRKYLLEDVQIELLPHIQDLLLCAPVNGNTSRHSSVNVAIRQTIILSYSRPFAA